MTKKSYEELEVEAKALYLEISALDAVWEKETEEVKLAKLESRLERLESRRERILVRMDKITDAETGEDKDKDKKEEKEEEESDFVCPDCGGDLEAVGAVEDNLYECVNCGEVYEVV